MTQLRSIILTLFVVLTPLFPVSVSADDITVAGLKIEINDETRYTAVTISPLPSNKSSTDGVSVSSFLLENPNRLVVDLTGYKLSGAANKPTTSAVIFAARAGSHPGKLRIVFDLATGPNPALSVLSKEFPIELRLTPDGESSPVTIGAFTTGTQAKPEPRDPPPAVVPATTSTTTTTTTSTTSPLEAQEPATTTTTTTSTTTTSTSTTTTIAANTHQPASDQASSSPAGSTAPLATQGEAPTISGNVVRSLSYRNFGTTPVPAIAIEGKGLSAYTLKQISSNGYELLIEGIKLRGQHLTLPQFPPDTFTAFEVVTAKDSPRGVIVTIFVEEGAKLSPFVSEGTLWLKIGS